VYAERAPCVEPDQKLSRGNDPRGPPSHGRASPLRSLPTGGRRCIARGETTPCTPRYGGALPRCTADGGTPPCTPAHGGTLSLHCLPTGGRRRKHGAPRTVAEVKARWLLSRRCQDRGASTCGSVIAFGKHVGSRLTRGDTMGACQPREYRPACPPYPNPRPWP
jgi:hypothetical protein